MSFARWLSSAVRFALVGAVALLFAVAANAQVASLVDSSRAGAIASNESSSNDFHFLAPDADAEPSAPASSHAGGGGQYDNRGAGRSGGWLGRMAWEAGGGFNAPTNYSGNYITWGGNLTVGGGMHLSHGLSVLAEYQFIDDKLPGKIIAEAGATGGNVHIWSLTLDPVVDLMPNKPTSVYVTGGGGFYREVTSFTDPQQSLYCDYFFCSPIITNAVVGHYSSNQGGWNLGAGISHRFGGMYGDGKMELFAEARYLDVLSPAVTTQANGLGTTTVGADTKLIPVTFGVRF